MVPEAHVRDAGAGLVPSSTGWLVMNARDARWFHRPGRGDSLPDTQDGEVAYGRFPPAQPSRYRDGLLPD
jgi:hypothetical protein